MTMFSTNQGNRVKCACGGYLKPEGIDHHLETRVHFDSMRYPNGFKYETTDKLTYVVIYNKCATMEEKAEAIRTYPNVTDVCTYLKYIRDQHSKRVAPKRKLNSTDNVYVVD